MKIISIMFLFSLTGSNLWAQKPAKVSYEILLGDSLIKVHQFVNAPKSNILFFNMHEDEQTSIEAVHQISKNVDLNFIYLEHSGNRRIGFNVKKNSYSIDPNRIYTSKGRKATLKDAGNYSFRADRQVKALANHLLNYIEDDKIVVAMHNNTDVNYSIKSYLPDGDESENTKSVFINEKMDADDFIYTTVEEYYNYLLEHKVNVILQDNEACVNDGSLSVYCGKKGIPYLNIEAQKGHLEEQIELLRIIAKMLKI